MAKSRATRLQEKEALSQLNNWRKVCDCIDTTEPGLRMGKIVTLPKGQDGPDCTVCFQPFKLVVEVPIMERSHHWREGV